MTDAVPWLTHAIAMLAGAVCALGWLGPCPTCGR
jgi:hypothetical protein